LDQGTSAQTDSGSETGTTTGEPTTGEPTTGEPTTGEPTEGPTTGEPTTEDPTTDDPTTDDPTTDDPTTEDPTDPSDSDPSDTDCMQSTWYEDLDGDGYGDPDAPLEACDQPDGYVDNPDDCRDKGEGAEVMSPEHTEVCDDFDNDCDGVINEFSGDNAECGECDLDEFEGSVYFFCNFNENWDAAREYCSEAFGAEVDLVMITNDTENDFVQDNIGFGGRWIGASDLANEDSWLWIDDSNLDFDDWGFGQPTDIFDEDCARTDNNRWESRDCGMGSRFICEGPG